MTTSVPSATMKATSVCSRFMAMLPVETWMKPVGNRSGAGRGQRMTERGDRTPGRGTRRGVLLHHGFDRGGRAVRQGIHHAGDDAVDLAETDAAVEERLHGDFVGGIEQCRGGATGVQRIVRQCEA